MNARQKLSRRLGGRFTIQPKLPKGTKLVFREPAIDGVEPKSNKGLVIAIVLLLLAAAGGVCYWHCSKADADKAAAEAPKTEAAAADAKKADEKPAEAKPAEDAPAPAAAEAPAAQ